MKNKRGCAYVAALLTMVFLLTACGQAAPHPPKVPAAVEAVGTGVMSTDKVALWFDNTRNTRGFIFDVDNSNFVKTIDQLYETMFNGWKGSFYALSSEIQYLPLEEAVSSRTWTKSPKPKNFKNAYKLQEFYGFSIYAHGRGPIQRLVEDADVDTSVINVFVTDLIEQDNQSSAFAQWLIKPLLDEKSDSSIIVLRIESKYNGTLSVPEEGRVSTSGGELQMIDVHTTSLPFFCVMQGPTNDLILFCDQLTSGLDSKSVAYEQTNVLAHGGISSIAKDRVRNVVKPGQVLSMQTAGAIPISNSHDTIYLTEINPSELFPDSEEEDLPNFGYTLDSGRKEAGLNLYVALPDVQLPEGRLLRYAMENASEGSKSNADVLLNISQDSVAAQKGFSEKDTEQPPKTEFKWEELGQNVAGRYVTLSGASLVTDNVPRYDPVGLTDRQIENVDKELAGTISYRPETKSGSLHLKLEFKDLNALKSTAGIQPGANMLWLQIPVTATYVRNEVDESIFNDTAFGSFYRTLQGRTGSAEVRAQWEAFWQAELINLTVCIKLK